MPLGKWRDIAEGVRALFLSLPNGVNLALLNAFLSCSFGSSWQ